MFEFFISKRAFLEVFFCETQFVIRRGLGCDFAQEVSVRALERILFKEVFFIKDRGDFIDGFEFGRRGWYFFSLVGVF